MNFKMETVLTAFCSTHSPIHSDVDAYLNNCYGIHTIFRSGNTRVYKAAKSPGLMLFLIILLIDLSAFSPQNATEVLYSK